jgi:polyisoprenoid-binding protein YceI
MSRLIFLLFFSILIYPTCAQHNYRLSAKESRMVITGTSSLHDWQCRVEQVSGQAVVQLENGSLQSVNALTFGAVVTSIRSIKENGAYYEKGMDMNVYKALKAEKHPNITFTLAKIVTFKPSGSATELEAAGTLRISGTAREITFPVKATKTSGGIIFEGKVPVKMRDYNVEPPTALFGTIKTGNDVVVDFSMVFQPVK